MRQVQLTQGKVAMVSDADYKTVGAFTWRAVRHHTDIWYAVAHVPGSGKRGKLIKMHRLLAAFPPFRIDHKNRNGLDNRRSNLRPATNSQNIANSGLSSDNTSGVKGVHRCAGRWMARIMVRGKRLYLGCFDKIEEGAAAYAVAAQQHFGEFARI